jgi:hypothetical protein
MTLILSGTDGLSDVDGSAATPAIRGTDANTGIFFPAADTIAFATAGTEDARFDASGNLGVGTSSPGAKLQVAGVQTITSGSGAGSANGLHLWFNTGTNTAYIQGYQSGVDWRPIVYNATQHVWQITDVEKARIDSSGNLLVGTTSTVAGAAFVVSKSVADYVVRFINTNATAYGLVVSYSGASPNSTGQEFFRCVDSTADRMLVRSNGGIANYSANNVNLSDRREKTNFTPATSYLDKICAIPVQTFNYIDQNMEDDGGLTLGVVAQDVQAVAPELVMESNWASKDDEPKMRLSIYQTDLQYALMKSIQELKAIVDAQAVEIAALKGTA